ncbi:BTAD domain-containing putative transcriptional regulator [Pseudonocardia sp. NPDC046786]|uniref:AfsR/SARP family transcriptional regulator n=1 Tax=Pseudonocardia sp. NPDC046786 TaxID=3155471 RepID=UPI0033C43F38
MLVEVLGPVRLSTDEGVPVEVAERKLRLLLVSLVVSSGEPVSADVLIDRLWGERLPADPKKVLRAKLSHLRTALERAQPGGRDLLVHTPVGYRLAAETGVVDAERFKDAVEHARHMSAPQEKTTSLRAALNMWRGEPYGDAVDEVWLAPMVAELRDARGDALELLAEALVEQGAPERAIEQVGGVVKDHPTRERLIAALMQALYQVGRQHDALEMFESLRHRLAEGLGVDPSPAVRELHGRILRQDPALSAAGPSVGPARVAPARTNVAAETSPLIGREREASQINAIVAESRLVTLTGIGGVGKTRLALHVAREQEPRFDRGAWFIDLTELTRTPEECLGSAGRIAALVVAALGLPEQSTGSELDRVCEALASRAALFVVDNCEHVVVEAAVFAAELLRRAPGVRLLATSREPLGLPDEHRYDVGTLSTKPADDGGASEAALFFAARARAADPAFCLDEDTTRVVTELCRRLDGLPLALELAAGRIRGISARDLLERLSDRLNILRRPGHGVRRRQQTLRGMIDWSWSLLDDAERAVLRRLAVHPGTLTLDAAEVTCADDPDAGTAVVVGRSQVVDVLIGLVERSLVTTTSTPNGVRYGLLESIAAFAGEKLHEQDERDAVARRHLTYYLDLAVCADARLRGTAQRRWLARLDAERTQLSNAFGEAARARDGGSAAGLAVTTFWYHWMAGNESRLHQDLSTAISLPGPRDDTYAAALTLAASMRIDTSSGGPARVDDAVAQFSDAVARARWQWVAGTELIAAGYRTEGEQHVDQALVVLQGAGDDWTVSVATCRRDWLLVTIWGEQPRGPVDGRDPERVLRELGDRYALTYALAVKHRAAEVAGDRPTASAAAGRALTLCRELGLWSAASLWTTAQAINAVRDGDVAGAAALLEESRALASDTASPNALSYVDFAEAMIARQQGDTRRAAGLLRRWKSAGDAAGIDLQTRIEEAFLTVQEGRTGQAEDSLVTLHRQLQCGARTPTTARLLELAAAVRALRSEPGAAAALLGTAEALRARTGPVPSWLECQDVRRIREQMAQQLSEPVLSDAIVRGRSADPGQQLEAAVQAASPRAAER